MSRAAIQHTRVISLVNGGFLPDKGVLCQFSPSVHHSFFKTNQFYMTDHTQKPAESKKICKFHV